jgi:hypothetical protein
VVALAGSYAEHALAGSPAPPPAAVWAAWLSNWLMVVPIVLFLLHLPLRFPDGHLLSPRWRWASRLATALAVTVAVTGAFRPIPLGVIEGRTVSNPAGAGPLEPILAGADVVADVVFAALVVAVVTSTVLRYRRSRGVARQQMRWFTTGLVVAAAAIPVAQLDVPVVSVLAAGTVGLALPAAIGVAVTRYRLYDLGHLLNRTAVYAIVSTLLVGIYTLSVVVLPVVIAPVGRGSDLVVAGSTLAAAAAFGPLRRQVQELVDRHFDRARYDSERTVEDFAHRLRHEVDLAAITDDVASVVRTTVQPSGLSVWFRTRPT